MFITFEGIDGSGKSTQARLLADALTEAGHEVVLTREPGGSEGAEEIRELLLRGATDRWSAETECLLFTAARRDHLEKTILPALRTGKIVISDRFADSTRLYQGISRGDLRGLVDRLHEMVIGREPDLTFIIDINPTIGLERALSREGSEARFEEMGVKMQSVLRMGFLKLAQEFSRRCVVVDGARPRDSVADKVLAITESRLATEARA